MTRKICVLALAAALLLGACSSRGGTQVSEDQVGAFKVGRTTYDEVIAALGPPNASSVSSTGDRMATYSHTTVRTFLGPASVSSATFMFTFNKAGVLSEVRTSQLNSGNR